MADGQPVDSPLISVKQLAGRLNLSTKTVYTMARSGQIPAVRRPGQRTQWRFDLPAVLAALSADAGPRQ
jgi:excisionase family DNA binding protein